ncbi:MAG: EpsG family protein [Proteobacteria bacterium]|nr:EpsG family protein [Pseudomonadota bacterium]
MVSVFRMLGYVGLIVLVTVVERYNLYRDGTRIKLQGRQQHNISIVTLALISLLFGLYSIASTRIPYALDRAYYVAHFSEDWANSLTIGLNSLQKILILFSNDPKILFFTVTFLCAFLVFLAHRVNRDAKPNTLLYLVLSEFFIYSFYFLKQAPAMALAAIATTLLLQEKKLLALLLLVLAILFHESALIIIPVYILILCADIVWVRRSSYILMGLVVIFFIPFSRVAVRLLGILIPNLLSELQKFIDDTGAMRQAINIPTTLKGVPFYLITLYGFRRRKEYIGLIQHYDKYMIMSVFVSITVLLSAYMYWMWRFGTFFFFPIFVFASQLASVNKDDKQDNLFSLLLMASLGFWTLRYLWRMFYLNGGF